MSLPPRGPWWQCLEVFVVSYLGRGLLPVDSTQVETEAKDAATVPRCAGHPPTTERDPAPNVTNCWGWEICAKQNMPVDGICWWGQQVSENEQMGQKLRDGPLPVQTSQSADLFPLCSCRSDFPPRAHHSSLLSNHHPQPLISMSVTTPGTKDALFLRGRWRSANYKPIRLERGRLPYLISVGCAFEIGSFVPVRSFSPMTAQPGSLILAGGAQLPVPNQNHPLSIS